MAAPGDREPAPFRIRAARWPEDGARVARLDTSCATDRVLRLELAPASAELFEERLPGPRRKDYGPLDADELREMAAVLIAEVEGALAGAAALRWEAWNRRAVIEHLFVAPEHRGRGCGGRLLEAVEHAARELGARCLWVETQAINAPAVAFYRKHGFTWCGFDTSLYDPEGPAAGEIALFFTRPLVPDGRTGRPGRRRDRS